jgi:hypothetical protein
MGAERLTTSNAEGRGATSVRDAGLTLIEVTVAVIALAVTATGILTAMVSGIGGSSRHRDHATATAWLHSAADYLELSPMAVCGGSTDVVQTYEDDIRTVDNSDGWDAANISVTSVQYWNGSSFGTTCYEDLQLVTIEVTSPDHDVTESTTIVKSAPYVELSTPPVASDPFASCAYSAISFASDKTGAVTNGSQATFALKKPSLTKESKLKDGDIKVLLTTSGNCTGKLRIVYTYPHKDHFHTRTIDLKLLKGTTSTYVGKFGSPQFKQNATVDLTIEQGRTKSKTWGAIGSGLLEDKVKFT